MGGVAGQEGVNWDRLGKYRLERARERMRAHNLGALLLMYDENVRYVTSTLTPGWNRLKPGLRYALLCGDGPPVLFEQGDIGFQIQRHAPWIPEENIRWSYAWIKGAAGPASKQQVKKFTDAVVKEMRRYDVADQTLGVDFIDINMLNQFGEAALTWNGYKSCYYRTYCVGKKPTQEMKDYYATALKWLYDSIHAVRPGATTRDIALKWPSAREAWGYAEEDQAAANLWGHGLGLAQYDQPVISRIWSLDHPLEIRPGMVFALETQHGKRYEWGVRIEEMLIVHPDRTEIISNFPVEEITVVD